MNSKTSRPKGKARMHIASSAIPSPRSASRASSIAAAVVPKYAAPSRVSVAAGAISAAGTRLAAVSNLRARRSMLRR